LQSPNSTDVTTKNGEVVSVSDTLIGDDTGEIRLVGWRQHSAEVRNLVVGDRVRILGASATRGLSGQTELTLRAESSLMTIK
jgi:replication factor A1